MERRRFLQFLGVSTMAGIGLGGGAGSASPQRGFPCLLKGVQTGEGGKATFVLPDLPYATDALAPVISAQQLQVHHDKHHAAYVKGLNDTLEKISAASAGGDTAAIRALCDALAFNYGGHLLHTLYWFSLQPGGAKAPEGALADLVNRDFGSFDALKKWLGAAAIAVQGSGWALLALEPLSGRLMVLQTEQHHKVLGWGMVPLLAVDVWEHAYYLDYQNRRADYVAAVLDIVNWDVVGKRLIAALA